MLYTSQDKQLSVKVNENNDGYDYPKSKKQQPKKSVFFFGKVRVVDIPSYGDSGDDIKDDLWYSHDELEDVWDEALDTMEIMEEDGAIPDDNEYYCSWGLRTSTQAARRKKAIAKSVREVVLEQHHQWEQEEEKEEYVSPDILARELADLYSEYTSLSEFQALQRGRQVAKHVAKCQRTSGNGTVVESCQQQRQFDLQRTSSTCIGNKMMTPSPKSPSSNCRVAGNQLIRPIFVV